MFTYFIHLFCFVLRDEPGSGMKFLVSVSSEECPDPSETETVNQEVIVRLPCKQEEIFKLNKVTNIRWMKVCTAR